MSNLWFWTERKRDSTGNAFSVIGMHASQPREIDEAPFPKERADGWLEIELGEFSYERDEEFLKMSCKEMRIRFRLLDSTPSHRKTADAITMYTSSFGLGLRFVDCLCPFPRRLLNIRE